MADPRVAVVTGSNKGIGLAIVAALCRDFDGVVYLTSRDVVRGTQAVAELERRGLSPRFHQLDLDDEASAVALRDHLEREHGGLDVLVNNAATYFGVKCDVPFAETARRTVDTNVVHTLRLCDLLFPLLRPHGRVVNLSSDDGHLLKIAGREPEAAALRQRFAAADLTVDQLRQLVREFVDCAARGDYYEHGWPSSWEVREDFWPDDGYIVSKVAVGAMTRVQQRRFDADGRSDLIVNCVHPGYVRTDATLFHGDKSVEEGSVAATWLALLPANVDAPKGAYIWWDKQPVDWVNGPVPEHY